MKPVIRHCWNVVDTRGFVTVRLTFLKSEPYGEILSDVRPAGEGDDSGVVRVGVPRVPWEGTHGCLAIALPLLDS